MTLKCVLLVFLISNFFWVKADGEGVSAWKCGAEFYSKTFSEELIDEECPDAKEEINNCCITHDACYSSQTGRSDCDADFCSCLERATSPHLFCNLGYSPLFCSVVEVFGGVAYRVAHPGTQLLIKVAKKVWDEL